MNIVRLLLSLFCFRVLRCFVLFGFRLKMIRLIGFLARRRDRGSKKREPVWFCYPNYHIHTVSFSLSVTADSDGGQEDRSRKVVQIASPLRRKSLTRKMQEMKVMKQFAGILVTF
ncbi:uncharacterized protein LOC108841545 isoform X1 [Raphanus sativus]|uniref:Uncharacterized protein LOC108841545 isoform X1 n=1 Tax=Raphanus sativus TaxID=3726 RepID=A0A9W3CIV2_RAPSA|nr:uncharacterized protein LOC108841545 isoform X1 [Raphanus sativus]XP_056851443.1 uncharacterized protein LOC108841545 isoform X1 [Raphanus sativus]